MVLGGGRRKGLNPFPRALPPPKPPDANAPIPLTVFGINEPIPGPRWQALFAATWPGYRRWYLQRDVRPRPRLEQARRIDQEAMLKNPALSIGSSLLFEAVVVLAAMWIFCRRDF